MTQQIDSILEQITGIYNSIPHVGKFLMRRFENLSRDVKALSDNETLAQDTIRIALNMVGYNIDNMNQFERASTILNIVQENVA